MDQRDRARAAFRDAGIEFVVLTAADGRELVDEMDDGVRVVRAPTLVRASTAPVVPSWRSWIRRLEPDVIHVHMPNPTGELACIGVPGRRRTDRRDLSRGRRPPGAAARRPTTSFASRFLRRARRITVSSPRLAETTPALRGHADQDRASSRSASTSTTWSERPPLADEIRERYGPGPLVVLLGRLVHYKGAEVLVEAMRDVEARRR